MKYTITQQDYDNFVNSKPYNKVEMIWADIVVNLNDPFRREAKDKGFELAQGTTPKKGTTTFVITVPNATRKLERAMGKIGNQVLCFA